jgi:DNA invertase Pin-like site-specific DNA recombinase
VWHGSHPAVAAGRRAWAQAGALFLIVAGDGVAVRLLGGPAWLMVLYVMLGLALAVARIGFARRSARRRQPPPAADTPKPPEQTVKRRALGYVCVTRDAAGAELTAHGKVIRTWAADNGVVLISLLHDVEPQAGDFGARPALRGALERIAAGEADTLVTARLEDLSPTVANLPPLLRWFTTSSRTLVAIDLRLDTATEAGRLAASALAATGGWEHERLSARTRRGLQAARERDSKRGRAAVADVPELRERIQHMRERGMTLQAIADALNEASVPTLRGGAKWRPSSVQRATGYRRPPSQQRSIDLPDTDQGDDAPSLPD